MIPFITFVTEIGHESDNRWPTCEPNRSQTVLTRSEGITQSTLALPYGLRILAQIFPADEDPASMLTMNMKIDEINSDLLRQTLNGWQQGQPVPDIWAGLTMLAADGHRSLAQIGIALHDQLSNMVLESLNHQRAAEGFSAEIQYPNTRSDLLSSLAADFTHGNRELEAWSAVYSRYFSTVSLSVNEMSSAIPVTNRQLSRRLNLGLGRMVDLLQREELAYRQQFRAAHQHRHLPGHSLYHLFGVTESVKLVAELLRDEKVSFVSIEGIGGIGKTTLANAVASQMATSGDWDDILWISARHQWLTEHGEMRADDQSARSLYEILAKMAEQLGLTHLAGLTSQDKLLEMRKLLLTSPYLVVIDNLETVDDVRELLPSLMPLAGATRFLFTSRQSMAPFGHVHVIPVKALSLGDSRGLLESELRRQGRLPNISDELMTQLYQTIGGLPLAIKLTAAQMRHLPLTEIVAQLKRATRDVPGRLYTYIYRRSWQMLDDMGRQLLLDLLDISSLGESLDWLKMMSALPDDLFEKALSQLLDHSLLEMNSEAGETKYWLHRLTVTFLHTEILSDWGSGV